MWIGIRVPIVFIGAILLAAYIMGNVTALYWKGCGPPQQQGHLSSAEIQKYMDTLR